MGSAWRDLAYAAKAGAAPTATSSTTRPGSACPTARVTASLTLKSKSASAKASGPAATAPKVTLRNTGIFLEGALLLSVAAASYMSSRGRCAQGIFLAPRFCWKLFRFEISEACLPCCLQLQRNGKSQERGEAFAAGEQDRGRSFETTQRGECITYKEEACLAYASLTDL